MKEPHLDLEGNPSEMETTTWQLSVCYTDIAQAQYESKIIAILSAMSNRRVSIGTNRVFFYAYFDEHGDALKAEQMMRVLFPGAVHLCKGSFNVSNLAL